MAGWMTFLLVATATTAAMVESRAIPAEPISLMLDSYGNPIVFLREKRMAARPYSQSAMMFTGYYRPVRRSSNGGQATGVFAQGNAVSGEAYFGGMQPPHLKGGPEPADEQEVSSAEAQASPAADGYVNEEEEQQQTHIEEEGHYQPEEHQHHQDEHHQQDEIHQQEGEQQHHHEQHPHQDAVPTQEQHEQESVPFTTEASLFAATEETYASNTELSVNRPKAHQGKKNKKAPVPVDEDEDDLEDDEEEPVVPFVPFKGNRRKQGYPHLNNYFPMVFSFPGAASRSGSGGSPPGAVTAIANSYSTGKGGVASSVATAYGGPSNGKKRRTQAPTDE